MSYESHLPPPPRDVPLPLAAVTAVGSKIAWLVLAFSSIFFWLFCARADLSFLTFRPPYQETRGTVIESKSANASENNQRIYAVGYSYHVQGAALDGTSYVLGSAPEIGEQLTIEYLADAPGTSRIAGMRRDLWGPWTLLLALFPGGCLLAVILSVRTGLRRCRLLRDGLLTTAKLIEEQPTSMKINKRTVFRMIYEFDAYDGRRLTATARTHQPERLQPEEPLLYDALDPSRSVLLSSFPVRPEVDEGGSLRRQPAALFVLVLPGFAIALNLFLLAMRLRLK